MITLITGGIKSGKSDFALLLAERLRDREHFYFIATATPFDAEMKERIENHKRKRKEIWHTIEEPENLDNAVRSLPFSSVVLVDCITLWAGNIACKLEAGLISEDKAERIIGDMMLCSRQNNHDLFIVTNEVGGGIIPDNKLSRMYGDFLGKINQKIAKHADEVRLMVSGISMKLKGKKNEFK